MDKVKADAKGKAEKIAGPAGMKLGEPRGVTVHYAIVSDWVPSSELLLKDKPGFGW